MSVTLWPVALLSSWPQPYEWIMTVRNALLPTADQAKAFFHAEETGPFVMVNLLRFRPKALYPDGSDAHLTGAEAYARYAAGVSPLVAKAQGHIIYSGAVTGLLIGEIDQPWDMVALVEYPSLKAFLAMTMSADYAAIAYHREAGLEGQLNIRTQPTQRL